MCGNVQPAMEKRIKRTIEGLINIPDKSKDFMPWRPFHQELRSIGQPAIPYLIETLKSQRDKLTPSAKMYLLFTFSMMGCRDDEQAVEVIISYLDDDGPCVHQTAETVFSHLASPGVYVFFDSSEEARAWWQKKKAEREIAK